jgi:hypothetical protein
LTVSTYPTVGSDVVGLADGPDVEGICVVGCGDG